MHIRITVDFKKRFHAIAVGFYDALGSGRPVEFAYKFGCAAIWLSDVSEQLTPIFKKKPNIDEKVIKISLLSVLNKAASEASQELNDFDREILTELNLN